MIPFEGFSDHELGEISLPEQFFSQLLRDIDSLEELKLTLYVFWLLEHTEGKFRYIRKQDLTSDEHLLDILRSPDRDAHMVLETALDASIKRGTLLEAKINAKQEQDTLYFLNSPEGHEALKAIKNGEWYYSGDPHYPVGLNMYRPNIFRLYENNIGPLTPMIAETLQDAEKTYPPNWIEEAIRIAVENNKRSWRYIEAILRRWQEGGRDEREDRRDTEKSLRRYKEWENSSG
jgi:DnaD/phage-associated family protein